MVKDFTLPVSFDQYMERKWKKAEDPLIDKEFRMKNAFKYFRTYINKK